MRVTTKTGDKGWTELLFGRRVRKSDPRIEIVGTLDELNSFLGLAKCMLRKKTAKALLHSLQCDLFIVGAEIAALPDKLPRLKCRVDDAMIERVEGETGKLERTVVMKDGGFIIPGENRRAAVLDVCRAVARRAERQVSGLRRSRHVPTRVPIYLNRLSDLLYLLARREEKTHARFIPGTKADGRKRGKR